MTDGGLAQYLPWVEKIGVKLEKKRLPLFDAYLDELIRWNSRMNLVGPSSRDRIVRELILDSLMALPLLPATGKLLDVGSGAGFPAIPMKIGGSELDFTLIEPIQKRVNFLKQIVRITGLTGISVVRGRIDERGAPGGIGVYDVVTARAVAPLTRTIKLFSSRMAPGGALVTFHGEWPEKVFEESSIEIKDNGLTVERLLRYRLPGLRNSRHVALLRKKNEQ